MSKGNSKAKTKNRVFFHRLTNSTVKDFYNECSTSETVDNANQNLNDEPQSLRERLREWVLEFYIPHRAVNRLLKILNLSDLPLDSRALLKTPRDVVISDVGAGKFWHSGISNNLRQIFANVKLNTNVKLDFNIDGIPLFNSSKQSFWPILACIDDWRNIKPFVVSIWCGDSKPNDLSGYLYPFVSEMKEIIANGIEINDCKLNISIGKFIFDLPARAQMKGESA